MGVQRLGHRAPLEKTKVMERIYKKISLLVD